MNEKETITVEVVVEKPIDEVWEAWNNPDDIINWNTASDDWHTPNAENDFQVGGKFLTRMEAKDGSEGFDLTGTYDVIKENQLIEYTLDDGRKVSVVFEDDGDSTIITETFEAEDQNSLELQQNGWQAILDNFKKYMEME